MIFKFFKNKNLLGAPVVCIGDDELDIKQINGTYWTIVFAG